MHVTLQIRGAAPGVDHYPTVDLFVSGVTGPVDPAPAPVTPRLRVAEWLDAAHMTAANTALTAGIGGPSISRADVVQRRADAWIRSACEICTIAYHDGYTYGFGGRGWVWTSLAMRAPNADTAAPPPVPYAREIPGARHDAIGFHPGPPYFVSRAAREMALKWLADRAAVAFPNGVRAGAHMDKWLAEEVRAAIVAGRLYRAPSGEWSWKLA